MTLTVLCIVAHPDDETRLCGGAIALLAARGAQVHLACLTRGEGGEMGEPPVTDREHLGDVREAELVCAAQKLGARSLTFLGYVDPTVGPDNQLYAPTHEPAMLAGQIVSTVRQVGAQVVLSHGSNGEYGHPGHLLVHQMTLAAIDAMRKEAADTPGGAPVPPGFYTFSASFPDHPYPRLANKDDAADLILDVTPVLDAVEAATLCHHTQLPLFVRRRSQELGRPVAIREVLLPVEGLHRVYGRPDDGLSKLLA